MYLMLLDINYVQGLLENSSLSDVTVRKLLKCLKLDVEISKPRLQRAHHVAQVCVLLGVKPKLVLAKLTQLFA